MAMQRLMPDTGTTLKPGPMTVAPPERTVVQGPLPLVESTTSLNAGFVGDLLAACVTHERMGVNLFRFLIANTNNPMLQPSYTQFLREAEVAVDAWELLITRLGGSPALVSPAGRMTEGVDQKLIESFLAMGSADPLTMELKGVEAVLLSATLCVANVGLIKALAASLPDDGEVRVAMEEAVSSLQGPAEEHLQWAAQMQQSMVLTQSQSKLAQTAGAVVEQVAGKVKDLLGR